MLNKTLTLCRARFRWKLLSALVSISILIACLLSNPIQSNSIRKAPLSSPMHRKTSKVAPQWPLQVVSHQEEDHQSCNISPLKLLEMKQRYGLGDRMQYLRREVEFTRKSGLERKRMTNLVQDLVPQSLQTIDFELEENLSNSTCHEPIQVNVPASGLPSTVNASDFIFGVSTTFSRFMDPTLSPLDDWSFWLTDGKRNSNGGKLVLTLLDATEHERWAASERLFDIGIDVDVYASDSRAEMAVRYLQLVPTLYNSVDSSMPMKKWFVLCDDDTFFPNMHALVETMNRFDSSGEMYIGALSEDVKAIERHGIQAFGGAGVFLSLPLAKKVSEMHKKCIAQEMDEGVESDGPMQGDMLLRDCIYQNTDTRLTALSELWQLDFVGDPAGFYEWGIKPLSLHHYRSWHRADPSRIAQIAHACGEDCILQRFQTSDNFIISGYSIAHYPEGIEFDTDQMEDTPRPGNNDHGWNFAYKFGPQRPSLEWTGKKLSWELKDSHVYPDGSVLQTYLRRQDQRLNDYEEPSSDIDSIFELRWVSRRDNEHEAL